jgi:predicted phosphodiesterase
VKLRIYSDLHQDHREPHYWYPPVLPDDAETTLILAGDLWTGSDFISHPIVGTNNEYFSWIEKVAPRFKQVLIVLGNHDYWPTNRALTIKEGGRKCNEMLYDRGLMNVQVLDCDNVLDGDVLFVGCTLWTDMDNMDPLTMHNMTNFMRYDGRIAYETGPSGAWSRFLSERWVYTHMRHRDYLKLIFEQNRDKKIVAITHHIPLKTVSDPAFQSAHGNGYYSSDLSELILDNPHVKLWAYGHTHYQNETMLGDTLLVNNCVGYKHQAMDEQGLVQHKVIEI